MNMENKQDLRREQAKRGPDRNKIRGEHSFKGALRSKIPNIWIFSSPC